MENQAEKNEFTPKEKLQFEYVDILIESMNLETLINYSTTEECAFRLEQELANPSYCEEVKWYIQRKLAGMVDDTEDNRIDAYLRRMEIEDEMYEKGITDFSHLRPEDYPEYPRLEQLWDELQVLERQLESM